MKLPSLSSPIAVLGAMGLALLVTLFESSAVLSTAQAISDVFINLLKLISLPIIFLAITATITGMQDMKEMKVLGRKIFSYTIFTTLVASLIALMLFIFIDPVHQGFVPVQSGDNIEHASYMTFVIKAIPSNIALAFTENNVIGIALIALLFSLATLSLPTDQKEKIHSFFAALFAAVLKVTTYIIRFIPLAVFAFTILLVHDLTTSQGEGSTLFWYLVTVTAANLIQGLVVLPLLLKFKKISPLKVAKAMAPALTLAFFSKSSNATLPVAIRCAEERLGLSKKVASFSMPLCTVINMNACAGFILTTVLFVSMMNGLTFSLYEMIGWAFMATLAAIGNAGVPMGCYFLASAFLLSLNVPLHLMTLILPFYTLLDMLETVINIWSDSCVTTIVDKECKVPELVSSS